MEINQAIAQVLINFSNEYPMLAGILIIAFVMRPVNKVASSLMHREVEKRPNILNTKLTVLIQSKWYLKFFVWIIDTVFSVKIISDKQKALYEISKVNGQYNTEKNI